MVEVSIIIPVYKTEAQMFKRALDSVVQQNSCNYECIVIFDGEPDNLLFSILEETELKRVQVVRIKHAGVSAARNKGLECAQGKWISFLDADDRLPDNALRQLLDYGLNEHCEIVQGAYKTLLSHGVEIHALEKQFKTFSENNNTKSLFLDKVYRPDSGASLLWNKLFSKKLIVDHNIKFNENLSNGEDTIFVFDAVVNSSSIGIVPTIVYEYSRNTQTSVTSFKEDYVERIIKTVNAMRLKTNTLPNSQKYENSFNYFILFHLLLVQVHFIFNPTSNWSLKKQKAEYNQIISMPIFRKSLVDSDYHDFPFAKRVALIALRFRLFTLSKGISWFRQKQISG